jgi:hypothetical protein
LKEKKDVVRMLSNHVQLWFEIAMQYIILWA